MVSNATPKSRLATILTKLAKAAGAALAVSGACFAPALAQTMPEPLPRHVQTDGNGVDLATGDLFLTATDVAIGGLSYGRVYAGTGWRPTTLGTISSSGSTYTVSMGASSESFTLSGTLETGSFSSDARLGSMLEYDSTDDEFIYTTAGGTESIFDEDLGGTIEGLSTDAVLVKTTAPNGSEVNYQYLTPTTYVTNPVSRLQSVWSSNGYVIHFDYARDTTPTTAQEEADFLRVTTATAINMAVDYCDVSANDCTGLSEDWPRATYSGTSNAKIDSVTTRDTSGQLTRVTTYTYSGGKLTKVRWPGSGVDNLVISYHASGTFSGWVSTVNRGFGSWSYGYEDDTPNPDRLQTTVTNPLSDEEVVIFVKSTGLMKSATNGVGSTTSYLYDSYDRPTRVTQPEGNYVQYTYDSRGNVTEVRQVDKPTANPALNDIVTTATFPGSCSNPVTCNKPTKTTDARGQETDYVYDATHGGVTKITAPAPDTGADQPETRISYVQKQARFKDGASSYVNGSLTYVLEETSACATGEYVSGACEDGDDVETVTTPVWPTTSIANNLQPLSVTTAAGDSSVTSTTSFTYDAFGRLEYADGPLAGSNDKTRNIYDGAGQLVGTIGPDPDGAGALKHAASRISYNALGLVIGEEQGRTNGYTDTDWTNFVSLQKAAVEYDDYGRPIKSATYDGATTTILALSQTNYDAAGRVLCTAQRMNPSTFSSPEPDACNRGTVGTYGDDRIAKRHYTAAGQLYRIITAYDSALQQNEATYIYWPNGKLKIIDDAQGNRTRYDYDGHDRLVRTRYPKPDTPNQANSADDELITYSDTSGSTFGLMTKFTTRSDEDITYTYDKLGRVTTKHVPGSANGTASLENFDFTYDNFGRVLTGYHHYLTLTYKYDALGRLVSKRHNSVNSTMEWDYDAAGRVAKLTHPDGFDVDYEYDLLNRPTAVKDGSTTLASVAYDNLGRRASLTYANGRGSTYAYDGGSRLSDLDIDLNGSHDQEYDFSYNPASQVTERIRSNSSYDWSLPGAATDDYTANGLNQYESVDGVSVAYDDNGNMTTDHRGHSYTYAANNMLMKAHDDTSTLLANYIYSSEGLVRYRNTPSEGTTRFFHDGDQEIMEMSSGYPSPEATRRYIRLPGSVDEVLLMIDYTLDAGCTLSSYDNCQVWAHADRQGSTVATSDASGNLISGGKYSYSAYGESGAEGDSGFPFRYTGQKLDAATGLYYYKARWYDPDVGRFLQTDPIGYGDGMNMYAYAGGDPVNNSDPSGTRSWNDVKVKWLLSSGGGATNSTENTACTRIKNAVFVTCGGARGGIWGGGIFPGGYSEQRGRGGGSSSRGRGCSGVTGDCIVVIGRRIFTGIPASFSYLLASRSAFAAGGEYAPELRAPADRRTFHSKDRTRTCTAEGAIAFGYADPSKGDGHVYCGAVNGPNMDASVSISSTVPEYGAPHTDRRNVPAGHQTRSAECGVFYGSGGGLGYIQCYIGNGIPDELLPDPIIDYPKY